MKETLKERLEYLFSELVDVLSAAVMIFIIAFSIAAGVALGFSIWP